MNKALETLADAVPDGALLAVAQDAVGVSMAATRALVMRGARDLHLLCVPIGGIQADVLIGAGCVRTVETSAITLGEHGTGPRFAAALRAGSITMRDATCPAIHAALQAGEKGIPFIPLRGVLGTDLLASRHDWKVMDNPFAPGDPVVLLPAIRPDVALFHAPAADRHGNVFVGRQRDLVTLGHAARRTLVTVEAVIESNLMDDPDRAPGVLPALYVDHVALAPGGAKPLRFADAYGDDQASLARYAAMARTREGFDTWLAEWLGAPMAAAS